MNELPLAVVWNQAAGPSDKRFLHFTSFGGVGEGRGTLSVRCLN